MLANGLMIVLLISPIFTAALATVPGRISSEKQSDNKPSRLGDQCTANDDCLSFDEQSECVLSPKGVGTCQCQTWSIRRHDVCSSLPWISILFAVVLFALLAILMISAVLHVCLRKKPVADEAAVLQGAQLAEARSNAMELQERFSGAAHAVNVDPSSGENVYIKLGSLHG